MDIRSWTPTCSRVFSVLCDHAGEVLSKRDIAKHVGISPMSASSAVGTLEREGIVKVTRFKTIDQVSFNLSDDRAVRLKRAENLRRIALSGLVEFLESHVPGASIILFGSYSFGEDISSSDIDLAIIGRPSVDLDVSRFEQELFRRISLNAYGSWDRIDTNLRNSILSGILLSGRVELETT